MKLVILGCGRVGARLAQMMEQGGHEISIIDSTPDAFARLPETFKGQTVLGTGIDVDVLKSAGIEHADAFAALTNFDNTNIMACEVAHEIFGVKKVLARIYDPGRESLYHQLGLETVCPTTLISTAARDILEASIPVGPGMMARAESLAREITGASAGLAPTPATPQPDAPASGFGAQPGPGPGHPVHVSHDSQSQPAASHDHAGQDGADRAKDKTQTNGKGLRGFFRH